MNTVVLSQQEIRKLLPMKACIELMEDVLVTLAKGNAINPLRNGIRLPDDLGVFGMMPGYLGDPKTFGLKAIAVFPGNHGTPYDSHQGVVVLFETEHGQPYAILDASEITAIRTAAVSAVATKLLARKDAAHLAIIGTGVQGMTHLEAMANVGKFESIRVFSRNKANRNSFADYAESKLSLTVTPMESVEEAVREADVICTTTSSKDPIVKGAWLTPGCHINAVGSSVRFARELDTDAVLKSRLFVDRIESTVNEAGDFLFPKKEGVLDDTHIVGEIGDILAGTLNGRNTDQEITLFKSLGLAVEDLAAAHYVVERAREKSVGTNVNLGGAKAR